MALAAADPSPWRIDGISLLRIGDPRCVNRQMPSVQDVTSSSVSWSRTIYGLFDAVYGVEVVSIAPAIAAGPGCTTSLTIATVHAIATHIYSR